MSALFWSGSTFAVASAILYAPVMYGLRKRLNGCRPLWAFPLAGTFLGLAPTGFIVGAHHDLNGFFTHEALLFYCMFTAVGITYGLLFVRSEENPPNHSLDRPAAR